MPADLKKSSFSLFPKLDSFDLFSIALWLGILVPAVQLPGSATFSFLRAVFFVVWVSLFALFVAYRINIEKRVLFTSSRPSNWYMLAVAGSILLSLIFSASRADSLYGYDLTFYSSALIGVSLVSFYFLLRTAGFSLEFGVSRVLATLPASLVILDLVQILLYTVLKQFPTLLEQVAGNYSLYFTFLKGNAGFYGNILQALFLHIFAITVLSWQVGGELIRNTVRTTYSYIRFGFFAVLAVALSYLLFVTLSGVGLAVVLSSLLAVGAAFAISKSAHVKKFAAIFSAVFVVAFILGGIWWKLGVVGEQKTVSLSYAESRIVVQQSFQGSGVPIWRHLVGFGQGTFPYLYTKYRSITAAKTFTNDTFFFKPATFIGELYVEQGLLGVVTMLLIVGSAFLAVIRATTKTSLIPESVLLVSSSVLFMVLPSSLALLVVLFAVLASLFDKVETLPESLPTVKAIDVKETSYTNRSVSKVGHVALGAATIYAGFMIFAMIPPFMTMLGYARSVQRFALAREQAGKSTTEALATYESAYDYSTLYKQYCTECPQLSYVSLSTLLGINELFGNLTSEQKASSQELHRIKNLLMQSSTELLGKNSLRYDYWLAVAQAYRTLGTDDESTVLYTLAVQSARNIVGSSQSMGINQYSADSLYLYIDLLMRVGNDVATNTTIKEKLAVLVQLVGTPIQVQFVQGIVLARDAKYDDAIKLFEGIKTEVQSSATLSEAGKKQLIELADKRIEEVKKLKSTAGSNSAQTTVTVTPTPTSTIAPTAKPSVSTTPSSTP